MPEQFSHKQPTNKENDLNDYIRSILEDIFNNRGNIQDYLPRIKRRVFETGLDWASYEDNLLRLVELFLLCRQKGSISKPDELDLRKLFAELELSSDLLDNQIVNQPVGRTSISTDRLQPSPFQQNQSVAYNVQNNGINRVNSKIWLWAILIIFGIVVGIIFIENKPEPEYDSRYEPYENSGISNEPKTTNNQIPGRFPQASTRYLNSDDLKYLSAYELKIMRNEIFARHGYVFKTAEMKAYFNDQLWYRNTLKLETNDDVSSHLNEYEKHNISIIKSYE